MSLTTTTTTAAAPVEEKTNIKTALIEKTTKDKEDEVEGTNVAVSMNAVEFDDPAILMVRSATTSPCRYTKEELMKLKDTPLSKKRPEYLNTAYDNANGIWDPERWHYDLKASETLSENGSRANDVDNHRRRSGDPRERLRKEQDGIVLSPQRRSFNSGCFVPVREPTRANRSHSPHGKSEPAHIVHREIPQGPGPRRIGSGRILSWETEGRWEKSEIDTDFGYRRERRDTDRDERRSFGREVEIRQKEKERPFPRNTRYNDRRRISDNREEEPEWFSEGPMSQHDTIELRGFDESEKITTKKKQSAQKKKAKERTNVVKNSECPSVAEKEETTKEKDVQSTPTPQVGDPPEAPPKPQSPKPDPGAGGDAPDQKNEPNSNIQGTFNIEDFLKGDTIPGLLTNGVGLEGSESTGSKFSRWFKREKSPPMKMEDSRRSSLQDDPHHLIKNILNDIGEPNVTIPGDSDSYFAPISPAASTRTSVVSGIPPPPPASKPINLVEMLQRGKIQVPLHADVPPAMKNIKVPAKVFSVGELESQLFQGGSIDGDSDIDKITMETPLEVLKRSKGEEDVSAFKRLLAQVCGGTSNGPIAPKTQQPMSIMEMLSHSQKQDEAARLAHMMTSANPPPHISNDISYKMQQQRQYDMLSKLVNNRPQQRTPPLPDMGIAQSRELLNRPEAQAILQGLKRGDITPQHLYQQLANPAMQSRHRELLQTILKLQVNSSVGPSPRAVSPVPPPQPPHHLFQQQQQQLSVSPHQPAMHQRIPSPRELQVHTQNIMQRALIKKKLEEQQENYRKKQEMQQRGQSPGRGVSPAKHVSSPTQLAFTPTSVLRKMTAEKDEGKDSNKSMDAQNKMPQGRALTGMRTQTQPQQSQQQWNNQFQQMNKQPVGRPIVKNANYQQTQQHDQFLQQQQRLYCNQQQQRKLGAQDYLTGMLGQFGGPQQFNPNQQQFSQITHQLRAQHQQQHARAQQQQQQPFGGAQWQQILHNQNYDNRQMGRVSADGGDMSPTTTNQLTRWFSPELLERARKGKLPNMPPSNLAQHALSLEEIERQTTPAIHN